MPSREKRRAPGPGFLWNDWDICDAEGTAAPGAAARLQCAVQETGNT